MAKKKLPPEVLKFFGKQGAKGGKIGGSTGVKKTVASMTPGNARNVRAKPSRPRSKA
jgi:hypothetical protein